MTSAAIRLSCVCLLAILSICSGQTNGSACEQFGEMCADDQACCDAQSGVKCVESADGGNTARCLCFTSDQIRPGGVCCSGNITASKCPRGGVDILCRNNSDCAEGLDCVNFHDLDKSLSLHRAFRGTCQVAPTTSTPPRKPNPRPTQPAETTEDDDNDDTTTESTGISDDPESGENSAALSGMVSRAIVTAVTLLTSAVLN